MAAPPGTHPASNVQPHRSTEESPFIKWTLITVALAFCVVFLLLPEYGSRLADGRGSLVLACLLSVALAAIAVTSFYGELRLRAWRYAAHGALAMILTAVGIYGVMSSMVARRTRELGVRLALGARPATLLGLVLRRGVFLTLVGLAAGLMAGALSSFAFRAVFVGGGTIDPVVAGLVIALVLSVALLACVLPARRAMRLDPVDALRAE